MRRRAPPAALPLPALLASALLVTALLALAPAAAAQAPAGSWTVQAVAFRDLSMAGAVRDELRALGFDAYTEFAMQGRQQWVRVRIGCFATRAGAQGFAAQLKGNVVADAVPLPATPGAPVATCVSRDVGFLIGSADAWERVETTAAGIAYRLELAGVEGWLRHDGVAWELAPSYAPDPASGGPAPRGGAFVQVEPVAGRAFVARSGPGGPVIVCAGRLAWQRGDVVVVEQAGAVVACRAPRSAASAAARDDAPAERASSRPLLAPRPTAPAVP